MFYIVNYYDSNNHLFLLFFSWNTLFPFYTYKLNIMWPYKSFWSLSLNLVADLIFKIVDATQH